MIMEHDPEKAVLDQFIFGSYIWIDSRAAHLLFKENLKRDLTWHSISSIEQ